MVLNQCLVLMTNGGNLFEESHTNGRTSQNGSGVVLNNISFTPM
jgi:hypothetical protein